eukprot:COSAG05_NODE_1704_length_4249_cov_5.897349_1_plen_419_part_00
MPRCRPRRVLFLVLVAAVFMVGSQSYLGSQQNFTANTFVEINQDGATPFGISEEAGGDQKPGEDPELQESDLEKLLAADSAEGLRFKSQEASLRAQILQVVDPTGGAEAAAEARLQNESPPSPAPPSALPVEVVPETAQRQRQPPADGERESLHSVPTPTKQPLKLLPIIGKAIDPPPPADPAAAAAAVAAAGGITTGVRSGINGIEGGGDPRQAGRTAEQRLHQQPGPNSLTERQQAVVNSMQWAWKGYKGSAWGRDELHPVSQSATDWFGLGLTLIDALDTLWLMGLNEEFNEAREWVASSFHPEMTSKDVNLFETTIRVSYRRNARALQLDIFVNKFVWMRATESVGVLANRCSVACSPRMLSLGTNFSSRRPTRWPPKCSLPSARPAAFPSPMSTSSLGGRTAPPEARTPPPPR